jgi:aminoglycoside phosphotransferase (APT) family kinase protein
MPTNALSEDQLDRDAAGWATGLLAMHGLESGPLQRMEGWSNSLWASGAHVVRISSGRFEHSLSHEAEVLHSLPHVPCPRVLANGLVGRREWMIQTRAPGVDLMQAWPHLDPAERERAVRSLAQALRAVHATPLRPALREPPWRAAALRPAGDLSTALRVHPRHYRQLAEAGLERSTAAKSLLRAGAGFIEARLGAFADDREVLTHGDLTFANVIWDGCQAHLVDFEGSGAAPIDRELDLLLRFVTSPEAFSPAGATDSTALYEPVIAWLRDAYPDMFAHPELVRRLEVYDALWELVQLLNYPADHPRDTAARLETIVTGRAPWKAVVGR